MTQTHQLSVELRARAGKGAARTVRRAGRVPGVIYGGKQEPVLITLDPSELSRELHKIGFFATLFDLKLGGAAHRVLPRDVQFDPVSDKPLHIDFLRVTADSKVVVQVPVEFVNEPKSPGLKRGGVLNVVRHEIELRCLVDAIPRKIVVDLEGLDIGDSIHISHVKLPDNVRPTVERDFTVATIASPSAVRAEALEAQAAAQAAAAAPEVPVAPAAATPAAPGAAPPTAAPAAATPPKKEKE
ncbi:MAG TPA: 50S ribosomal protein L25/general stress protein Ctc [Alphaproteobacteria bacterium]|nr:50S ribosomal protein L25/general stress protein Ctc [Alphaproteobacteria bacterium]